MWFCGGSGTGKSYAAQLAKAAGLTEEDVWTSPPDMKDYMLNYRNQKIVVFDDFRAGDARFSQLLKLMDKPTFSVKTFMDTCVWKPWYLIITSIKTPMAMYADSTYTNAAG